MSVSPPAEAQQAAAAIRRTTGVENYHLAVMVGSGWAAAAESLGEIIAELPAGDIPGFSVSGVAGHRGTLTAIRLPAGGYALAIGARTHLYEGQGVAAVAHGVRTAAALGCQILLLTNGAGGVNPALQPGQPLVIRDHLNLTGCSPLLGPEFVDLTEAYDPELRRLWQRVGEELGRPLSEGVYAQLPGPHYETPAETQMLRLLGADAVGMSTVLETIAARACGLRVSGISLITNAAASMGAAPLSHEEVLTAGVAAEPRLAALLRRFALGLGRLG